ncbi:SNG1 family protein [Tomitella gaofuii]|uniref:SNG1 family protein n=1 Tax=Tomitella gaofuii TaxID=2760083 RepID=UPI001F3D6DE1|nr:SNG1 family protein [Tomitella gaofuii]
MGITDKSGTKTYGMLAVSVIGLAAAVALMLLSFLAPQFHSGPEDLPLGVAGAPSAVDRLASALDQRRPGAFDVTVYGSADDVQEAIRDREVIGGIAVAADGAAVYTASGAGSPYGEVLTGVAAGLEDRGSTVTVEDVAPTADHDPSATGLSVLALPLAFGGMISAAVLSFTLKKRHGLRVFGSLAFSLIAGFVIGAILRFGFGTFDADYWAMSGVLALGIAATSEFVLGLESLIGYAGLAFGGVLTLFVSNPLSGIATGWQWLPAPWGEIGQLLPIGAAGNAARSVGFFDGASVAHSVWTLVGWIVVGLGLSGLSVLKNRGDHAPGVDAGYSSVPELERREHTAISVV